MSGIDLTAVNEKLNISMSTLENWYFDEDSSIKKLLSHFKISALELVYPDNSEPAIG